MRSNVRLTAAVVGVLALAGSAQALAAIIPGAQALDIPGRDHMPAVGDKVFKAAVLKFLEHGP